MPNLKRGGWHPRDQVHRRGHVRKATFASIARHKIQFQRQTTAKNEVGDPVVTWTDLGTPRWARVVPWSESETYQDEQQRAVEKVKFTVRADHLSVTTADRIVFKGKNYDIKSVVDIQELEMFLEIWGEHYHQGV